MGMILAMAAAAAVLCGNPAVHDGDTIRCAPPGPGGRAERIRIANIDAPELAGSPKCGARRGYTAWCDDALGQRAGDALRGLIRAGHRVTLVRTGTDSYGRTLALVQVDGVDVGEWLIARGLARRWR